MATTKADKLEQEYEALALQIEAYERDHAAVISKYKQLQENLETTFGEAKDAVKAAGHDVEGQCWRFAYITSTKVSYDGAVLAYAIPSLIDDGVVSYTADRKRVEELYNTGRLSGDLVQAARREIDGPASVRLYRKEK